ncbi:unnamed protein product [Prorocentrum cordatum]|uniref:Photosystem II 12 kDa extrinsic protein n=1 Tax=Prorocentrum cordatum TaxID=2364126 RepID=A0ABN9WWJ1_9DINO|nr:unnamed protein product [Polarella glacialis]
MFCLFWPTVSVALLAQGELLKGRAGGGIPARAGGRGGGHSAARPRRLRRHTPPHGLSGAPLRARRPMVAALPRLVALAAACLAACLAAPASSYLWAPAGGARPRATAPAARQPRDAAEGPDAEEEADPAAIAFAAAGFGIGAVLGWFGANRQKAASAVAASAVALAQSPAFAEVDYVNIEDLGGSNKVGVNDADVQTYRQFPVVFPTAAGFTATRGPCNAVSDMYKEPDLEPRLRDVISK